MKYNTVWKLKLFLYVKEILHSQNLKTTQIIQELRQTFGPSSCRTKQPLRTKCHIDILLLMDNSHLNKP